MMKPVQCLRHNEDVQIEKLKRVRKGKCSFLIYLFYLPLGLFSVAVCIAMLLAVVIGAFTLTVSC